MYNILIIPDLHQRYDWVVPCLKDLSGKYDKVVLLGDYLDNFDDAPEDVTETANLIQYLLNTKEFNKLIFCIGNHDIAYRFWHNQSLGCSGNAQWKHQIISSILTEKDWNKMKLFHYEKDSRGREWYFSHGGIHKDHFEHPMNGVTKQRISYLCQKAVKDAAAGVPSAILSAGRARGNRFQAFGGILWLDWNCEFAPIEGVNQIVGHTPIKKPEEYNQRKFNRYGELIVPTPNSENWCFDTHSKHIGWWRDGKVSFETNKWYKPEEKPYPWEKLSLEWNT